MFHINEFECFGFARLWLVTLYQVVVVMVTVVLGIGNGLYSAGFVGGIIIFLYAASRMNLPTTL